MLDQDYDNFQAAIVVDSKDDPAYVLAKSVLSKHWTPKSEIWISKPSTLTTADEAATSVQDGSNGTCGYGAPTLDELWAESRNASMIQAAVTFLLRHFVAGRPY